MFDFLVTSLIIMISMRKLGLRWMSKITFMSFKRHDAIQYMVTFELIFDFILLLLGTEVSDA